jgi:hypothetical protein
MKIMAKKKKKMHQGSQRSSTPSVQAKNIEKRAPETEALTLSFNNIFNLPENLKLISELTALSEIHNANTDFKVILNKIPFMSEKISLSIQSIEDYKDELKKISKNISDLNSKILDQTNLNQLLFKEIEQIKSGDYSSLELESKANIAELSKMFLNFKSKKMAQISADIDLLKRRLKYEDNKSRFTRENLDDALLDYNDLSNSAEEVLKILRRMATILKSSQTVKAPTPSPLKKKIYQELTANDIWLEINGKETTSTPSANADTLRENLQSSENINSEKPSNSLDFEMSSPLKKHNNSANSKDQAISESENIHKITPIFQASQTTELEELLAQREYRLWTEKIDRIENSQTEAVLVTEENDKTDLKKKSSDFKELSPELTDRDNDEIQLLHIASKEDITKFASDDSEIRKVSMTDLEFEEWLKKEQEKSPNIYGFDPLTFD